MDFSTPLEDRAFAQMMNSHSKVVFSETLDYLPWRNSSKICGNLHLEIVKLKAGPGKDIEADMEEDDKQDHSERSAQQFDKEVVEDAASASGPGLHAAADQGINNFGDDKRQENIDERSEVLPKRF